MTVSTSCLSENKYLSYLRNITRRVFLWGNPVVVISLFYELLWGNSLRPYFRTATSKDITLLNSSWSSGLSDIYEILRHFAEFVKGLFANCVCVISFYRVSSKIGQGIAIKIKNGNRSGYKKYIHMILLIYSLRNLGVLFQYLIRCKGLSII